jgi:hypothetical protein
MKKKQSSVSTPVGADRRGFFPLPVFDETRKLRIVGKNMALITAAQLNIRLLAGQDIG